MVDSKEGVATMAGVKMPSVQRKATKSKHHAIESQPILNRRVLQQPVNVANASSLWTSSNNADPASNESILKFVQPRAAFAKTDVYFAESGYLSSQSLTFMESKDADDHVDITVKPSDMNVDRTNSKESEKINGTLKSNPTQEAKDKQELEARERLNNLVQKHLRDNLPANSYGTARVRYLKAVDHLRPKQYKAPSSLSAESKEEKMAVQKQLRQQRDTAASLKARYDELRALWIKYDDVAQVRSYMAKTDEENWTMEQGLNDIEDGIHQDWTKFCEQVAKTQKNLFNDVNVDQGQGIDSDITMWMAEALKLKADDLALKQRRELSKAMVVKQSRTSSKGNKHKKKLSETVAEDHKEERGETKEEDKNKAQDKHDDDHGGNGDSLKDSANSKSSRKKKMKNIEVKGEITQTTQQYDSSDGMQKPSKPDTAGPDKQQRTGRDQKEDGGSKSPKKTNKDVETKSPILTPKKGVDSKFPKSKSTMEAESPTQKKETHTKSRNHDSKRKDKKTVAENGIAPVDTTHNRKENSGEVSKVQMEGKESSTDASIKSKDQAPVTTDAREHLTDSTTTTTSPTASKGGKLILQNSTNTRLNSSSTSSSNSGTKILRRNSLSATYESNPSKGKTARRNSANSASSHCRSSSQGKNQAHIGNTTRRNSTSALCTGSHLPLPTHSAREDRKLQNKGNDKVNPDQLPNEDHPTTPTKQSKHGSKGSKKGSKEDTGKNKEGTQCGDENTLLQTPIMETPKATKTTLKSPRNVLPEAPKIETPKVTKTTPNSPNKSPSRQSPSKSNKKGGEDPWKKTTSPSGFKAWTHQPAAFKEVGRKINVTVQPKTDYWRKTRHNIVMDNAPFYWHKASGDFEVIVHVSGTFATSYDMAGIMIRHDNEHWITSGVEYFDGGLHHTTSVTHDYTDRSLCTLSKQNKETGAAPKGAWICLKRIGNEFISYYSFNATQWNQTRQGLFHADADSAVRVGVFGACPMGQKGFTVEFDKYSCKPLPKEAPKT